MWEELLRNIAPVHYEHLKNDTGFPGVCYISSQILATYLRERTGEDCKIVYGTFGQNNLFHCWVEFRQYIIDFTLFQFIAYKERKQFYQRMSGGELLEYAEQYQDSLIFGSNHPIRAHFKGLAVIQEEFNHLLLDGDSYDDFMSRVYSSDEFKNATWFKSKVDHLASETFGELIDDLGYRITKRFFSKWAIVRDAVRT